MVNLIIEFILKSPLKLSLILLFIAQWSLTYTQALTKYEFSEVHMGTLFRIVLYADSAETAKQASDRAFDSVEQINQVFSDYVEDSELSQISQRAFSKGMKVSDEMWRLLSLSDRFYRVSNGAFNIAMGPLTKLWRRAIRRQEMPDALMLREVLALCDWRDVILDERKQTVRLKKDGMRLDMGGIAKGYAIDEAYQTLEQHGIPIALVDGGGDIFAGDSPPESEGWKIIVEFDSGSRDIYLTNEAIASSGSTYKFIEHNDIMYSHIIDPRTGYGISNPMIINVRAESCMLADAAATALSILSDDKQRLMIEEKFQIHIMR